MVGTNCGKGKIFCGFMLLHIFLDTTLLNFRCLEGFLKCVLLICSCKEFPIIKLKANYKMKKQEEVDFSNESYFN